jgi:hypothetical protein
MATSDLPAPLESLKRAANGALFGEHRGHLVDVRIVRARVHAQPSFISIRTEASIDEVAAHCRDPISAGLLTTQAPGLLQLAVQAPTFGSLEKKLAASLEALVDAAQAARPAPEAACVDCKAPSGEAPVFLVDHVARVCSACLAQRRRVAVETAQAYASRPRRLGLALAAGWLTAPAAALVWALLAERIDSGRMWAVTMALASMGIGRAILYAAGKGGWQTQAIVWAFAALTPVLGMLLYVGVWMPQTPGLAWALSHPLDVVGGFGWISALVAFSSMAGGAAGAAKARTPDHRVLVDRGDGAATTEPDVDDRAHVVVAVDASTAQADTGRPHSGNPFPTYRP